LVKWKIILIRQKAEAVGNIETTALNTRFLKKIRCWQEQAKSNPNAQSAGIGGAVESFELEHKRYMLIEDLCPESIPVRSNNIISQATNLDETGQFQRGNAVSISHWIYYLLH
jgi:hypothetical protein